MLRNKNYLGIFMVLILLVGCGSNSSKGDEINVSALIEKGTVELSGSTFNLHLDSISNFKYEGENVVEASGDNQKIVNFYDENILSKQEIYSGEKHIASNYYTYDNNAKEVRVETVIEMTKDKTYKTTSYDKNYKEIRHYDSNDALTSVSECILNDKEQIIMLSSKSKDGTLESESHYAYEGDNLIFQQLTDGHNVLREIYYKYNEFGDETAYIAITFGEKYWLDAMYYDNVYEDSKLVQQSAYGVHAELSESQAGAIGETLK